MSLAPGQRLGAYEIVGPLGAGGMGEVFRARDTRLGRDVAIKVLPEAVRTNPDARARFEREARAVAALSHPNILAIHDVGDEDGTAYAVMEFLEGRTLRDALAEGPLPPRKAVEYARQIARGLGAAHDGGVVHRDLKPENLFVTRDGRVKILDFGLARAAEAAAASVPDDTPTFTHLTGPGTVLGTINYMSPEQARGESAGPSSDMFSLGSVLFETLTGRRPFERDTAPETMTAILREDPAEDLARAQGVSPAVQRIVQRCLEKRPEERFQSAHDLAFALETSSGTTSGAHVAAVEPVRRRPGVALWPVALAAVAGVAIGAWLHATLAPARDDTPVRVESLTFSGVEGHPAASPDGRTVAFGARRGGVSGIWVKQLGGGGEAPLTRGSDSFPRFSPDGSTVLFTRVDPDGTSIYVVPLLGGTPRKLIDDANEADWSPDGSRVVFKRGSARGSALGVIHADGSGERVVREFDGEVVASPRWSPRGDRIAFVRVVQNNTMPLTVTLLDLASGEIRDVGPVRPSVTGVVWSGSGNELVFGWSEDLLAGNASTSSRVSIMDVGTGETSDLFWTSNLMVNQYGTRLDIVAPGRMVLGTVGTNQGLREEPLGPGHSESARVLTDGNSVDRQPAYSPDGETILFSSNRSGNLDLWTIHRPTGTVRQLTDDAARDWDPAFVGDGSRIVWSSDRGGNLEIWTALADGSGARQVSNDGVDAENPTATPDGAWVVYMTSNPSKRGLWKVRMDGTEATHLWEGSAFIPEVSPDGRYVAFVVQESARANTLKALDLETGEVMIVASGLTRGDAFARSNSGRSRWVDDGRSITFILDTDEGLGVMRQPFVPGEDTSDRRTTVAGFDAEWSTESFDIAPGGERIVLSRFRPQGTILLADDVPEVTPPRAD